MAAPKSRYERSDWYTGVNFRPGSPENVTSERVESKHRELREKTCPGYSGKDIPRLEERIHDTVNAELSVLTNTLNDSAPVPNGAGEVIIDWSTCMTRLSLNVLCQLGFAGVSLFHAAQTICLTIFSHRSSLTTRSTLSSTRLKREGLHSHS